MHRLPFTTSHDCACAHPNGKTRPRPWLIAYPAQTAGSGQARPASRPFRPRTRTDTMPTLPPQPDADFQTRLAAVAERITHQLAEWLGDTAMAGEISRPPRLMAAMRHAALAGGKRLRPFLVIETARLFGRDNAAVWQTAAAVECVHCYSLVHDDLPAMDDDDLRRGQPTVHRAYDEATAILAGDALLTYAFDLLADLPDCDGTMKSRLVLTLARASGLGGMAGGQMLDLAAEGRFANDREKLAAADVQRLQAMKTGALMVASVQCGAILGGADAGQFAALTAYAQNCGAVFQIADDILDIEASAETMGKATGKDDVKGKATLVNILGLETARKERDRLTQEALAALNIFDADADILRAAAHFAAARKN